MSALLVGAVGGTIGAAVTTWLMSRGDLPSVAHPPLAAQGFSAAPPGLETGLSRGAPAFPQPSGSAGSRVLRGPPPPFVPITVVGGGNTGRGPPDLAAQTEMLRRTLGASAADLDRLIDAAVANPDENARRRELVILFQRLAVLDADRALRRAVELGRSADRNVWSVMVNGAMQRDSSVVAGALEHAKSIRDARFRDEVLGGVIGAWANQEPMAAIEYVNVHADDLGLDLTRPLAYLASAASRLEPRAMLAAAERLRPELARAIRTQVLGRLGREDPRTAIDYLSSADIRGAERQSLVATVANGYAAVDADAALAWARAEQSSQAEMTVLARLAQTEPQRAIAHLLENGASGSLQAAASSVIAAAVGAPGADVAPLAEMIVAAPRNALTNQALQTLLGQWVQSDTGAALEWLVARGAHLPVELFRNAASQAGREPGIAAAYVERVPAAVRSEWAQVVAGHYARADSRAALTWIERFRGEPLYGDLVLAAAQGLAQNDPRAAVRLLDGVAAPRKAMAYANVAMQWTQADPPAAADWAAGVREPELAAQAQQAVLQRWLTLDARAAESWAFRLPAGASRDAVLTVLATHNSYSLRSASPDDPIWNAFADSNQRQQMVFQVAMRLRQSDPDAARRLVDRLVTNDAMRATFERTLNPGAVTGAGGEARIFRAQ